MALPLACVDSRVHRVKEMTMERVARTAKKRQVGVGAMMKVVLRTDVGCSVQVETNGWFE